MNTVDFLTECEQSGISITMDGQDLIIQPDNIESSVVEYIRGHKKEIINTLTPSSWSGGDCHSCGELTGAMLTTPDGFIGWCCPDCFDKRAGKPLQSLAA